ncbi:chorismate mutase [Shewanella sp. SR44-3]|uniref:chorismate mutase n=1 Tax=Shewanella sp. SR44-3 TaxID=2760936 RepID=UPI0015F810B6|nr:chorismate mutase [Shewanella sp. SR44-3]MBB1269213.1 chorismate mutase [Shewanella sp. SR44-3]
MTTPPTLDSTREQITALDNELLTLLAKRRNLSLDVARSKEVDIRPIRDTQREKELLARLVQKGREQGLDAHFVVSLYQGIIEDSVLNQQAYLHGRANPDTQKQQYAVAYLGAKGSYSFLAASRYCQRRQVNMLDLGCQSFDEIIQSVESGHADYGFLPIENTSSGSINEVYDVLQHTSLSIVGETTIEVGHCLLTKADAALNEIKTVYAHPQPISQCSKYLSQHPEFKLEYCASSAEAMAKVIQAADNSVAAIGSAEGGALYQLHALEKGLANQKINQSRFIVVARKAVDVPSQLPAKTTLIMATGQKPGALVEALLALRKHNLNMSKLESRPIPGTPWEEMFYLDVDANIANPMMQDALLELSRLTRFIKVLGCYPCETVKPTQLSQEQLILAPESVHVNPVPESTLAVQAQPHSRNHKSQDSQVSCQEIMIGANALVSFAYMDLSKSSDMSKAQEGAASFEYNEFEHKIKAIKETGFQGVILGGQIKNNKLAYYSQTLRQAGLICILTLDDSADIDALTQTADLLLLSGSQMYNQSLLTKLGTLTSPVILERHPLANINDWLRAADTLLSGGNKQLILCDSGISNPAQPKRLALDLAALVEIKGRSHLPIIINPSHSVDTAMLATQAQAVKQLQGNGIVLPFKDIESLGSYHSWLHTLYS